MIENYKIFFVDGSSAMVQIDPRLYHAEKLSQKRLEIRQQAEKAYGKKVRTLFFAKETANGLHEHMVEIHHSPNDENKFKYTFITSITERGALLSVYQWLIANLSKETKKYFLLDGVKYRIAFIPFERLFNKEIGIDELKNELIYGKQD